MPAQNPIRRDEAERILSETLACRQRVLRRHVVLVRGPGRSDVSRDHFHELFEHVLIAEDYAIESSRDHVKVGPIVLCVLQVSKSFASDMFGRLSLACLQHNCMAMKTGILMYRSLTSCSC